MANNRTIDAYRQPAKRICDTCEAAAVARCPRCGRLLCLEHMPFDEGRRCEDCEAQFVVTRDRITGASWTAMLILLVLCSLLFLVTPGFSLIVALGGFAAVALCGGMLRLSARRRFLARGRDLPILLADAQIPIGPKGEPRSQPYATLPITRLEPPNATMPLWQRTYGVG